jgi:hypothetical protein
MSEKEVIYSINSDKEKVIIDRETIEDFQDKIDAISLNIAGLQGVEILLLEKIRNNTGFSTSDLYSLWALIKSLADKSKVDLERTNDIVNRMFYSTNEKKSKK